MVITCVSVTMFIVFCRTTKAWRCASSFTWITTNLSPTSSGASWTVATSCAWSMPTSTPFWTAPQGSGWMMLVMSASLGIRLSTPLCSPFWTAPQGSGWTMPVMSASLGIRLSTPLCSPFWTAPQGSGWTMPVLSASLGIRLSTPLCSPFWTAPQGSGWTMPVMSASLGIGLESGVHLRAHLRWHCRDQGGRCLGCQHHLGLGWNLEYTVIHTFGQHHCHWVDDAYMG